MELPSMTSADGAAETNAAATTAAAAASETSAAAAAAADGVSWKSIGADGLWRELRQPEPQVTVLDCRSAADFTACHIRRAVHLSLPSIMLRRLAGGKVSIASVLKCSEARHQLQNAYGKHTFVLCGDTGADSAAPASLTPRHAAHEMLPILHKSLVQDGCLVVCLEGGVEEFRSKYPEWCMIRDAGGDKTSESTLPTLRLTGDALAVAGRPSSLGRERRPGSLGSRSASDSEEERPDSSLESTEIRMEPHAAQWNPPEFGCGFSLGLSVGLRLGLESEPLPAAVDDLQTDLQADQADPGFPVEILPYLFLGNAQNSRDCNSLNRHHIRYVVNVTPNLPNVFEDSGLIQYLQIPITDHWSQNLASFFPAAINFIEAARDRQEGVLVHCLAGISRSVTITVAYLMYKLSMSLNDAYDFVRRRKANISPNFNFMGQLLDFERQLNPPSPQRCTCQLSPANSDTEVPSDAHQMVLPLTRLSIEEKDDVDDAEAPAASTAAPPLEASQGAASVDSGVASSPCSTVSSTDSSSVSSPALTGVATPGAANTKRLRTFVCRCQASLAQCHFTTPTNL